MGRLRELSLPEVVVDLEKDVDKRWAVKSRDLRDARRLAKEAVSHIPWYARLLSPLFPLVYRIGKGLHTDEMQWWSKKLGIPYGLFLMLQCYYELGHGLEALSRKLFGCTAAVERGPDGCRHLRTLDWPLEEIGRATRVVRFKQPGREFVAVTPMGFIGVLSGMVPGAYSITLNYAPPSTYPGSAFGPMFLIRAVLSTCNTYAEAVTALSRTRLSTSAFFTVCGINQACVIERTARQCRIRRLKTGAIVQANHYSTRKFRVHNRAIASDDGEGSILGSSLERAAALESAVSLRQLLSAPVCNEITQQAMVFEPSSGALRVWVAK